MSIAIKSAVPTTILAIIAKVLDRYSNRIVWMICVLIIVRLIHCWLALFLVTFPPHKCRISMQFQ